jgi:hypothetical protein
MKVDHANLAKMELGDAMVHLREMHVPLTYEFMTYVSMALLFPHNPELQGYGPDISGGSNPLQGLLYHYLIVKVFSPTIARKLVPEFLNLAPHNENDKYLEVKENSKRKIEKLKEMCLNHQKSIPDFEDFYFRRPSDNPTPFVLPADTSTTR